METVEDVIVLFLLTLLQLVKRSDNLIFCLYILPCQILYYWCPIKQNFPLKYFYGESVNAIESQIWVCLIANLLLTVVNRKVKRRWAFSNLVTAVRQMLMYYVDIFSFLENPERTWERINAERCMADTGQLELEF